MVFLIFLEFLSLFAQSRDPAVPNPSQGARDLLAFLYNITGTNILSGQEAMMWDGTSRDDYVYDQVGKYPAIYASDFGDVNADSELPKRQRVVDNAISWHNKGAIILLSWNAVQPDQPESGGYNAMNISDYPPANIDRILTSGDSCNTEWLRRLDMIAGYLKQLRDAGVTVLWRPFHEMNGNWFWWSW
jgi:mannan endo-1,4-beta-mannosidase